MKAEILTCGTEILLGQIVDTNAAYLARQLAAIGMDVYRKTTVGDNEERLAGAVREALTRCDAVITSGGLGPTEDDVTRQAVAAAVGRELVLDEHLLDQIRGLFARRGLEMAENNRRQAFIPTGAQPIENPVGTAPGFVVEGEGGTIITLPGVPRELKHLMETRVVPYLREHFELEERIVSRVLRTVSLPESRVDALIADLQGGSNPTVGLAAHPGQIDVRIAAKASSGSKAAALIQPMEERVRERLGDAIYGVDEETVEQVVADLLWERDLTLAVLETNTGGSVCSRLTAAPHGPDVLAKGTVISSPARLQERSGRETEDAWLSEESAAALAVDCRTIAGADLGLAILGEVDPSIDPYSDSPGQSFVALATKDGTGTRQLNFSGVHEHVRGWVGNTALDLVRRTVAC